MHLAEIAKPSWWASSLLHCLIISVPSVLQCWLEIESFIFSFLIYNFLSVRTNHHRIMNLMLKISPWNKNISIQFNFYPIITVSSNDTSVWAVWTAKTKICGVSHHFQALFYSNANTPTRGNLIYLEQNWTIFISPASNLCGRSTAEENDGSQGLSSLLTQREYWITSTIFLLQIAALSPADINYEETLSTLRFGELLFTLCTEQMWNINKLNWTYHLPCLTWRFPFCSWSS